MISEKMITGNAGLVAVEGYLTRQGLYEIYRVPEGAPFDLRVEQGGDVFAKVQVKTSKEPKPAAGTQKIASYQYDFVSHPGGKRTHYPVGAVDIFAVVPLDLVGVVGFIAAGPEVPGGPEKRSICMQDPRYNPPEFTSDGRKWPKLTKIWHFEDLTWEKALADALERKSYGYGLAEAA